MEPADPQIAAADEILSTKWIIPILRILAYGPIRFSRIKSLVAGISSNILTARLRHLETNGLVRRKELPHPADRQIYELTESGLAAVAVLKAIAKWAEQLPEQRRKP
jgi:DNA-binding HxlR family transcriptional regulator